MKLVLEVYLRALWSGEPHRDAVLAAARAVEGEPWDVIAYAGLLARCEARVAERDLGLNTRLQTRKIAGRASIADIPKGALYPALRSEGRSKAGAFDTPREMAMLAAGAALKSTSLSVETGLDPACGTGALLLALRTLGVSRLVGLDLDPLALAVAAVALPEAELLCMNGLQYDGEVDVVVANPPFVSSERQTIEERKQLREKFPWLRGRFDLSVPFIAASVQWCRPGGGVGLIAPDSMLSQPYGAPLRRALLEQHRVTECRVGNAFPGASVKVSILGLEVGAGPAPVAPSGVCASALLSLPMVPMGMDITERDVALAKRIRKRSIPLRELCLVDTGVVAHLPGGSKEALLFDEPGPGRVPYADAKEFFRGEHRWLLYEPAKMHRAKQPCMFEVPKIVVQRIRGKQKIRAAIDTDGIYLGHTCTVVVPKTETISLEKILSVIRSPYADGLMCIERGQRLDLYPRDLGDFPVPVGWMDADELQITESFGLTAGEADRLREMSDRLLG